MASQKKKLKNSQKVLDFSQSDCIVLLELLTDPKLLENRIRDENLAQCECQLHKVPCHGPVLMIVKHEDKEIKVCPRCTSKDDQLIKIVPVKDHQWPIFIAWFLSGSNIEVAARELRQCKT